MECVAINRVKFLSVLGFRWVALVLTARCLGRAKVQLFLEGFGEEVQEFSTRWIPLL